MSSDQQLLWHGAKPLLPAERSPRGRNLRLWFLFLGAILALAVSAVYGLNTGDFAPALTLASGLCAVGVVIGLIYTRAHPDWLIFAIALLYLVIPVALVSDRTRGILHYGVLGLLCIPLVPILFRSALVRQGGFRLYLYYFAFALFSVTYSLAPAFSLGRLIGGLLGFAAIVVCVAGVEDASQAQLLVMRFTLACCAAVAATVVAGILMPRGITWQFPGEGLDARYLASLRAQGMAPTGLARFRGIYGNANDVGGLMLVTLGPILACWGGADRRRKWLFAGIAALAIGAAIMADSRSPLVALGIGGALYLIWRFGLRGLVVISALAGAAIGAVLLMHGLSYVDRGNVSSLTGRTDIWAYAIERIRERPLIGYGYEVSGEIFANRYFPIWYGPWDQGPHSSLHNGYIAHAVGLGLPMTALWMFIVLRPWWFIFKHKKDPWGLKPLFLLIIVPTLVLNLTEASLSDFDGIAGILFGLVWAIGERYRLQALKEWEDTRQEAFASATRAVQAMLFKRALDRF